MYRLSIYFGDGPITAHQVHGVETFVRDYYRGSIEPDDVENTIVTRFGMITMYSDLVDPLRRVIDHVIDTYVFEPGFHFNLERLN